MAADDRTFEKALSRHLRAKGASGCPDAETLAAYHEHGLSPEELASWKEHIAACADCRQVLAVLEQTDAIHAPRAEEGMVAAEESPVAAVKAVKAMEGSDATSRTAKVVPFRMGFRWTAPAGAVAAGLLVWFVLHERQPRIKPLTAIEVAENRPPHSAADEKAQALPQPGTPQQKTDTRPQAARSEGVPARKDEMSRARQQVSEPGRASREAAGETELDFRTHAPSAPAATAPRVSAMESSGKNAPLEQEAAGAEVSANRLESGKLVAAPPSPSQPLSDKSAKNEKQIGAAAEAEPVESLERSGRVSGLLLSKIQTQRLIRSKLGKSEWRVGAEGLIENSKDGGQSWNRQESGGAEDWIAGSAPTAEVCWLIARSGAVLLTKDGGGHWTGVASPITGAAGGIHATDSRQAEIWDATNRHRYATRDGGETWIEVAAK